MLDRTRNLCYQSASYSINQSIDPDDIRDDDEHWREA